MCKPVLCCLLVFGSIHSQARSQDFTLAGATEAANVHFFLQKSWRPFFSRHPQSFRTEGAHGTLLLERTVLLYWIKQALCRNKASFFRKKNRSIDIWGMAPLATPPVQGLDVSDTLQSQMLALVDFNSESNRSLRRSRCITRIIYRCGYWNSGKLGKICVIQFYGNDVHK